MSKDEPKARSERKQAIALRYRPHEDRAPTVTGKGSGYLAERILELARKHDIPVREDRDLVQVLSRLDLDQEIPPEVYSVVAEILAFIYRTAAGYRRNLPQSSSGARAAPGSP